MRPLGEWLRQRREQLEISLEQAEADTRIRSQYLEALEADDLEALPDQVVGRGFLRNYAAYLELDPQETADLYAKTVAPAEPEAPTTAEASPFDSGPFRPVPLHEIRTPHRWRGLLVGLAVILIVALSLLAWWGYPYISEWLENRQQPPGPEPTERVAELPTVTQTATRTAPTVSTETTEPAVAVPTEPTPTLEVTWTPTFTPEPSPTPTEPRYDGILLELVFTDTSWIQVTVDEVRQFQGELESGTYRSWYGEDRIELRIGNAGAVQLTVNGQNMGALGSPGEVLDRVFEKVGEEVTEATVTPGPTSTATVELAASPTLEPTAPISPTEPSPAPEVSPTVTVTSTLVPPAPEISPTLAITPTTNP
jgi:cytoskeleton protein RodZ